MGVPEVSMSIGLGEEVGLDESLAADVEGARGGGSIKVEEFEGTMDSGNRGISSAPEAVSIVI